MKKEEDKDNYESTILHSSRTREVIKRWSVDIYLKDQNFLKETWFVS